MSLTTKKRIEYLDALRGFTILLVIYSHLVFVFFNDEELQSAINQVFITFRMPLFFFISGFFVYSENYNFKLFGRRSKNRLLCQLYPTAVVFAVYILLFYEGRFERAVFSATKYGYWFTLSAVEFFFLTVPLLMGLSASTRLRPWVRNVAIVSYGVLIRVLFQYLHSRAGNIDSLFGLEYILNYYVYFLGGVLLKMNFDRVLTVMTNKYFVLTCVAIFCVLFNWKDDVTVRFIEGFTAIVVLHYVAVMLFKRDRFAASKVSRGLQYIGTMTLEIYLLHFIVFSGIKKWVGSEWIAPHINKPWEFVVVITLSAGIALICLSIVYLLKKIRVYRFIFPSLKR